MERTLLHLVFSLVVLAVLVLFLLKDIPRACFTRTIRTLLHHSGSFWFPSRLHPFGALLLFHSRILCSRPDDMFPALLFPGAAIIPDHGIYCIPSCSIFDRRRNADTLVAPFHISAGIVVVKVTF